MSKKRVVGTTVALTALLVAGVTPAANAIEVDTTPPELVSFTVTPSVIDARQGGTVKTVLHIKDATCLDEYEPTISLERNGEPLQWPGYSRADVGHLCRWDL